MNTYKFTLKSEEIRGCDNVDNWVEPAQHNESEESTVIPASYTCIEPFAVVVKLADTAITVSTMLGSRFHMCPTYLTVKFVFFGLDNVAEIKARLPFRFERALFFDERIGWISSCSDNSDSENSSSQCCKNNRENSNPVCIICLVSYNEEIDSVEDNKVREKENPADDLHPV